MPTRPDDLGEVLAAKRRRLGTALHELATEVARERRRSARLERENRRLREQLQLRSLPSE